MRPSFRLLASALPMLALLACSGGGEGPTGDAAGTLEPPPAEAPATPIPAPPDLKARSFILLDHDSGRVLAALDPDSRQEPASRTKRMSA